MLGVGTLCLAAAGFLSSAAVAVTVDDATAMSDSSCATRPSTVPSGYACTVLDEPSGNNPAVHGETWWHRDGDELHLISFALGEISGVQVCVRDTAAYDPVNVQADKCAGNSADRVFEGDFAGTVADVTVDLADEGITAQETAYWVIHVDQFDGESRTTTSQGSGGGSSPSPTPSESVSPSPSESPSESPSPSPSESVSPTESVSPSESIDPSVLPTELVSPSVSPTVKGVKITKPTLPTTGAPNGVLAGLGLGLIAAGVFLTVKGSERGRHSAAA